MLRNILGKVAGGATRRPAAGGRTTPTAGAGRPAAGGSANGEIARGAKSLISGLARKRRR
ncbi:hypothetical protein [uncultured Nocardioides sp.]|uniref:hypothetical protein n=1 Tax=uncultured Nocardioides sp. TaxID=198441 RepID=UPI00262D27D7|nr:hypothetical protein [uncultured Nocardioides sp.]